VATSERSLRYFGTDGVRGKAEVELTRDFAWKLGRAAGTHLLSAREVVAGLKRPAIAVGHDTRVSSPSLAEACAEGLASSGADVIYLGTVPTAVVAFAVTELGLAGGCVISASHNPPEDNGIKFFGAGGYKLGPADEASIEAIFEGQILDNERQQIRRAVSDELVPEIIQRYERHVIDSVGVAKLSGIRAVVDCANGAASEIAPRVLAASGAEVVAVAAEGDGTKINVGCGATDTSLILSATKTSGFSIGLALDGDADRLIAVDAEGTVYDGDNLMAAFGAWLLGKGRLDPPIVVATVMSNLGLRLALERLGVELVECGVGDREVVEAMRARGAKLGGEQSGHIVFADCGTTGDGILTAAFLLQLVAETGQSLAEAAGAVERVPQVLLNIEVKDKREVIASEELALCVAEAKRRLGSHGRLLVRPSGTEPLIRVMVESADEGLARLVATDVASVIQRIDAKTGA